MVPHAAPRAIGAAVGAVVKRIVVQMKALPALLRNADLRIREAVYRGSLAGCKAARSIIKPLTPRDLGDLREGWKVRTIEADPKPRARAPVTVAELYNDAPQLPWVELGTKPHGVSRAGRLAIYEWVRRHYRGGSLGSGGARDASRGRMRPARIGQDDPVIMAITWGIITKLKKYGSKPRLFVYGALPDMRQAMAEHTCDALNAAQAKIDEDSRRIGGV